MENLNNIEEILKQLKEKGIDEGKHEAERIIKEAEDKAKEIIENARKKAKEIEEENIKQLKEYENSINSSIISAGKNVVDATVLKIAEILEKVLKEKIEEELNSNEIVKRIIAGKKVSSKDLLTILREKTIKEGFEVKYKSGKITIRWENENFHYEISPDIILEEIKSNIREELHKYIFTNEK